MNAPAIEPLAVMYHNGGGYWRCFCRCGWDSKNIPFSNPDAALHTGALHLILCKRYGEGFTVKG